MFNEFPVEWAKISDFMTALGSGYTSTRPPDPRSEIFSKNIEQGEFKKSGVSDAAENLTQNIQRLHSHTELLASMFSYARRVQDEIVSRLRAHGLTEKESTDPVNVGILSEVLKEIAKWICTSTSIEGFRFHPSMAAPGFPDGWLAAGFAAIPDSDRDAQIAAFQDSLVIEAWTLFESLSEDLWLSAINSNPGLLGQIDGKTRLSFNFEDLKARDFNIRNDLGSLLNCKEYVSFRSLFEIRDSYRRTFREQRVSIDEILDDKGLQGAAAVRNLLIHKRGVVDDQFVTQAKGITELSHYKRGDEFHLSGQLCAKLADSCCLCAICLVNAVHGWIIGHSKSPF